MYQQSIRKVSGARCKDSGRDGLFIPSHSTLVPPLNFRGFSPWNGKELRPSTMVFQMCPQVTYENGCIMALVAFVCQNIKRNFHQICSRALTASRLGRIKWICLSSLQLQCGFSNVPSKYLYGWMHNHNGCTYLSFLQCVSSNVS